VLASHWQSLPHRIQLTFRCELSSSVFTPKALRQSSWTRVQLSCHWIGKRTRRFSTRALVGCPALLLVHPPLRQQTFRLRIIAIAMVCFSVQQLWLRSRPKSFKQANGTLGVDVRRRSESDVDSHCAAAKQNSVLIMTRRSEPDATGFSWTDQDGISPDHIQLTECSAPQLRMLDNVLVMSKTRKGSV
jgi:hypothetical protein